jgi:hypothetical protein
LRHGLGCLHHGLVRLRHSFLGVHCLAVSVGWAEVQEPSTEVALRI